MPDASIMIYRIEIASDLFFDASISAIQEIILNNQNLESLLVFRKYKEINLLTHAILNYWHDLYLVHSQK